MRMPAFPVHAACRRAYCAAGAFMRLALVGGVFGFAVAARSGPVVVCDSPVVDVGTVGPADKPVAEFRIHNAGDAPLELLKVRTSCPGCMTLEVPDGPIGPQAAVTLKVTLTGLPPTGPVRKLLYVQTNDPDKAEVQLTVHGTVRGAYALSPNPTFALGEAAAGKEQSWDYTLAFADAAPCVIVAIEAPTGVAVRAGLNRAAARHRLCVTTVPAKLPAGTLRGLVSIRTDSPVVPVLRIPLTLTVKGPVMPMPPRLMLGIPPAKDSGTETPTMVLPPVRQRILLSADAGITPVVKGVRAPDGVLTRVLDGPKAAVEVSLAPGAKTGPLGDIVIGFADAALPRVRVPVIAVPARAPSTTDDGNARAKAAPREPLPFNVLVTRLGQHLGCPARAVLAGGFRDDRTQLAVWLAERLCDPATVQRQARRRTMGNMSLIEYARARDEVTLRMQRDPEFKTRCEEALAAVGSAGASDAKR